MDPMPNGVKNFPVEILIHIFTFLKPADLIKCREVCKRWKLVIDRYCQSDILWRRHCVHDFANNYEMAYYKRNPGISWSILYRSLSLWSKLQYTTETCAELDIPSNTRDNILGMQVLNRGNIGILYENVAKYYNINTMKPRKQMYIIRNELFKSYLDNNYATILGLGNNMLSVIPKVNGFADIKQVFVILDVKYHYLKNSDLYYCTVTDCVYKCDLNTANRKCTLIFKSEWGILTLGYKDGYLRVLAESHSVITVISSKQVNIHRIKYQHLLDWLIKCNMLNYSNTKAFFGLFNSLHTIRHSLKETNIVKMYGDVLFIGLDSAVVLIYYAPYVNNLIDLTTTTPIKEFRFKNCTRCPVLCMCPVINIDVLEGENCHTVVICMTSRIVILKYSHNANNSKNLNVLNEPSCEIVQVPRPLV